MKLAVYMVIALLLLHVFGCDWDTVGGFSVLFFLAWLGEMVKGNSIEYLNWP